MMRWVGVKTAGTLGLGFALFIFGLIVLAQPEMAPPNPVFERYLEHIRAGRLWPIVTPEGYYLGYYIPEPVDISHTAGIKITDRVRCLAKFV